MTRRNIVSVTEKSNFKKILGVVGAIALAGTAFTGGMVYDKQDITVDNQAAINAAIAKLPVIDQEAIKAEGYKLGFDEAKATIEPIVKTETVNVTVEDLEMKENLQEANRIIDAYDDFVEEVVDEDADAEYILAFADGLMNAEKWIESDLVSFMKNTEELFDDGEVFEDYRKSEVSVKDIKDPEVSHDNYDDKDFELTYEVKIKAQEDGERDKEYFDFEVVVPFENGKIQKDDIEVTQI